MREMGRREKEECFEAQMKYMRQGSEMSLQANVAANYGFYTRQNEIP